MYKISMISECITQSFWQPPCLEIPAPVPELPCYLLGIPPLPHGAIPSTQIPNWLYTDLPSPFLPIPLSLSPTVPHFKYMPSYDVTISTSHSPIQYITKSTTLGPSGDNTRCTRPSTCPRWRIPWARTKRDDQNLPLLPLLYTKPIPPPPKPTPYLLNRFLF
jgi:hypothetical protein